MHERLDAATVLAIFALKGKVKQTAAASQFNVAQTIVSEIWLGKTWRSITGMPQYVPTRRRGARTG
jgi:hypothetical protein